MANCRQNCTSLRCFALSVCSLILNKNIYIFSANWGENKSRSTPQKQKRVSKSCFGERVHKRYNDLVTMTWTTELASGNSWQTRRACGLNFRRPFADPKEKKFEGGPDKRKKTRRPIYLAALAETFLLCPAVSCLLNHWNVSSCKNPLKYLIKKIAVGCGHLENSMKIKRIHWLTIQNIKMTNPLTSQATGTHGERLIPPPLGVYGKSVKEALLAKGVGQATLYPCPTRWGGLL